MSTGSLQLLLLRLRTWWVLGAWRRELESLRVLEMVIAEAIEQDQLELGSVRMARRHLQAKLAAATAAAQRQPQGRTASTGAQP